MTNGVIEKRLWDVANNLRDNSNLSSAEYSPPVLGLIFLRHADFLFTKKKEELEKNQEGSRRKIGKVDYQSEGVMYLPEEARFSYLLNLPEGKNIGQAIDDAMDIIEEDNTELKGTLPKGYAELPNDLLSTLLKTFSETLKNVEGDVFGKVYEYFLGKFALSEGRGGGEFFTPTSLVKLIVQVIEPFHGKILDPACGSGGMFVQSANFVSEHKKNPSSEISVYGQEKTGGTVKLCKMNLAVHGLSGDVKEGNTYYEDIHNCVGKFDFVMANPPFNSSKVDFEKVKGDPRWSLGLPSSKNANYLWIQLFYHALNETGRSGFVMANSAADARGNEAEIRRKLIENNQIDVMIAIGTNFFYTVTLPCTLWFMDKDKNNTERKDTVLFIDARHMYKQIDRAHREFTPAQIEFIANIARLYRGEKPENNYNSDELLKEHFPKGIYCDVKGLCKVANMSDIKAQKWSLNSGRYVGVEDEKIEDYDFKERLEGYNEELQELNAESHELEEQINININKLTGNEQ
jgi:type I restriction enzyme M protein